MSIAAALATRTPDAPPIVIADFSPPRSAELADLRGGDEIAPDYFCVAYAPGRAVRPDPIAVAAALRARTGRPSVVNIATRDANVLALSNALLGAYLLGVRDVIVLAGDDFSERDAALVRPVRHLTPSQLIRLIRQLNAGRDFRGAALRRPTAFSVGATIDLGRGIEREARLTRRKVEAGAMFLITQPLYDVEPWLAFLDAYHAGGAPALPPVLLGLDIPVAGGVTFSTIPAWVQRDLEAGRSGADIALDVASRFRALNLPGFYVVPPILKGGARDYASAAPVIEALRR
ncbi:MAG: methylenetetrahydrofolate reductase [Chloroflexota bacterium]|nr:methylenetetrahydrofolate reductase [Dehalococcoidia bacterium]MDW8254490.1 methylenetetrahydrofolate reductase [Chloroflexota bacterium]